MSDTRPDDEPLDSPVPPPEPTAPSAPTPEPVASDEALLPRDARVVPIEEAARLRALAQEAEARAQVLAARVEELERTIEQTREALSSVERRHRIDLALIEADAIDLESARVLTELALSRMSEPDEARAVAELRAGKPFLFRPRAARRAGAAMSPRSGADAPDALLDAAEEAARSGDRRAVLRYLQARRARSA